MGYPFILEVNKKINRTVKLNHEFLKRIFERLDWSVLCLGAEALGYTDLPINVNTSMFEDDDFLSKFHHALLEIELEEGFLICSNTGRKFEVNRGIPNLLLRDDEF